MSHPQQSDCGSSDAEMFSFAKMAAFAAFQAYLTRLTEAGATNRTTGIVVGTISVAFLAAYGYRRYRRTVPERSRRFKSESLPSDAFDAVIVGAGPSGSTAAWFMSRGGARVALLDKETFPRDKYCGDAVCTPAIRILEEMGVMDQLKEHNEAHFADAGGFVSPHGYCYIGASEQKIGEAAACAVKRIHLDDRLVKHAAKSGVHLKESFEVVDATFDLQKGLWTVTSAQGESAKGRVLVCADGATSRLATKLGYCTEPPKGVCSRAYVKGGTHNTKFDGVCFYPKESLPGYSAIFRHPNDELNFCYYLIPSGKEGWCGNVQESDLARLHNEAIESDPFISRALGPTADIERMKAGSLRLGCQGLKTTYDDHLIIVGDAAGHIDPLTGEGIHTAMMGGKAAAETVLEMMQTGDYTSAGTREYYRRWMRAFGYDFGMSRGAAGLIYRYPILLDACAKEMERKGDAMMAKWAEVMTCMRPKSYFLRPDVMVPMSIAVLKEAINQKLFGAPSRYNKMS